MTEHTERALPALEAVVAEWTRQSYSHSDSCVTCSLLEQIQVAMAADAARIEEVDRNARAYGWACGRAGGLLVPEVTATSENPFLDPNWRERLR